MLPTTLAVSLPEMANLDDHSISGKVIVPAVEILDFLLRAIDQRGIQLGAPLTMRDVSFPRFLPADEIARCRFEVALEETASGVRTIFSSKIALANGIERQRVHAVVTFGGTVAPPPEPPAESESDYRVAAERVYAELVRFGSRFRNLRGTVRLAQGAAWAEVESPTPPHQNPSRAGCPYLLDSAMHLACVWGQRYAGMVAYPTGFIARTIFWPVAHGRRHCTVVPRAREPRRLTFDLWLTDDANHVCDAIAGLQMSPIAKSAPPPAWIAMARSAEIAR